MNRGTAQRIVIAIIGGTVTLIGIALLVLPGPAFVVIPLGLSILATEFLWARRWLTKIRQLAAKATLRASRATADPAPGKPSSNDAGRKD